MSSEHTTYHTSSEFHHHHHHAGESKHPLGAHILQIEDLNLSYKKTTKKHIFSRYKHVFYEHILKNVNLSVHGNEIIALLGESGSGKTSIAKILTGQTTFCNTKITGKIYFSGIERKIQTHNEALDDILYIPQGVSALDPTFKYKINGESKELKPSAMSGGMAKKALINYGFKKEYNDIKLIIADEPTDGLDMQSKCEIMDIFKQKINENTGMLLITHDINVALQYADRIAIIKDGCVVEETSKDKFCKRELTSDFAKKIHDTMPKYWDREYSYIKDSICLFGDTGSGKTTIAKNLAGYLQGFNIPEIQTILGDIEMCRCEMIFQDPYTSFPNNSRISATFRDFNIYDCQEFKLLNIDASWLDKYPFELSGGQLQRLSILKTLLQKPSVLIADESTSMCDCYTQFEIFKALRLWCEESYCKLIFITHDKDIKDKVADKVIYLNKPIK